MLNKKKKTTEEIRAADRARKATEKVRAANKARNTTEKVRAADRARKATEKVRVADKARKATEEERDNLRNRMRAFRANVNVKIKDGLQNENVLNGKFQVPLNHIGDMCYVCHFCNARKFKNETGMSCCLDGKISLQRLGVID